MNRKLTQNRHAPVKRHRGVPGHTQDTRDTRAHAGTRITRTNLTTIQTQRHTRTTARRPWRRPKPVKRHRGEPGHTHRSFVRSFQGPLGQTHTHMPRKGVRGSRTHRYSYDIGMRMYAKGELKTSALGGNANARKASTLFLSSLNRAQVFSPFQCHPTKPFQCPPTRRGGLSLR